ncbi:bpb/poz domain-containing protein [Aphelenchoides avenae]|nr:bpb/poz domain-containing protein [Aphelenchus avenae]
MLESDELIADEKTVYTRLLDWAKCQLEQDGKQATPPALRALLGYLLYLVRFPLFDAKDFDRGPAKAGILTEEECLSLSCWFVSQSAPSLFTVRARRPAFVGVETLMRELGLRPVDPCAHVEEIHFQRGLLGDDLMNPKKRKKYDENCIENGQA